MHKKVFLLGVCMMVLLGGCTRYTWVKPFGDPSTYSADHYECSQSSMNAAPPVFGVYESYRPYHGRAPYVVETDCHRTPRHERCRTVVAPPPPPHAHTVDLNARNRDNLYDSCMRSRGWVWQAVEDQP